MEIFIRGGGFNNKGDEAMLLTLQRELARRIDETNFAVSFPTDHVNPAFAFGFMARNHKAGWLNKFASLLSSAVRKPHVCCAAMISLISALEISDLDHVRAVLDISGFAYSDSWGPHCADRAMAWAQYCYRHGKPYICLPQAWGPFTNPKVVRSVGKLVKNSSLVYARDETSLSNLKKHFPDIHQKLKLAPDIAFAFDGALPAAGAAFLNRIGISAGQDLLIGITPNQRVYERLPGQGAANEYIILLIKIVKYCVDKLKAKVVLIPHEVMYGNRPKKDDRFLCGLVKASLSAVPECVAINEIAFSDTTKSLISHLDLLIGSRFHSLVFALASQVPVVALGWSHKYVELLNDVGLSDFVLTHENFNDSEVIALIDKAWRERKQSQETINKFLPAIRHKVDEVFDEIRKLLISN